MKFAFCLAVAAALAAPVLADPPLGVRSMPTVGGAQDRALGLTLWYPGAGGVQENTAGNAVFNGVDAGRDAPLPQGRLPLILLSHGGLRSAQDSGAWLASALARSGFLVIEINPPRAASAAAAVDEIWQRPSDVSRTLDMVLNAPELSGHIAADHIFFVGFAMGGAAAMALAGNEISVPGYMQACDTPADGPDCGWFAAQNVTLDSVDQAALAQPRHDPRIKAAVAISPEYPKLFSAGSDSVKTPMLRIALGQQSLTEPEGAGPMSQTDVPGSTRFDAFAVCTPAGPEILAEDGGDPALCGTSPQRRKQAHDQIVGQILTFLEANGT